MHRANDFAGAALAWGVAALIGGLAHSSAHGASVDSNAAPAVCRSGSVSILVGGVAPDSASSNCNGFGRQAAARASTGTSHASPAGREMVATGGADQERRMILENELQNEMALLKQSERDNTEASRQAAARSRANIEALRREIARTPGPVVR